MTYDAFFEKATGNQPYDYQRRSGENPHCSYCPTPTIGLRDRLGPFRLACLEYLLRATDVQASLL
jgi:hypothetical protein